MKHEKSCGAVVFTRDGGKVRYVIIDNADGERHGFPKGHVEGNETELETAAREIKEETALNVRFLDGFRAEDRYPVRGGKAIKTVVYFLAEYSGQTPVPRSGEIGSAAVLTFEEAVALIEFESARKILRDADAFLRSAGGKAAGLTIVRYTEKEIADALAFEERLRSEEEDVWFDLDEHYRENVEKCFCDPRFENCRSFLAYENGAIVGRIDAVLIPTRSDGSVKGYLDWLCVLKSRRHRGVAQALLAEMKSALKSEGVDELVALTAGNDEAQRFYRSVPDSVMRDIGIWIEIK